MTTLKFIKAKAAKETSVPNKDTSEDKQRAYFKAFGAEVDLAGLGINTLLTVVITVGVGILIWISYSHSQDSRETAAAFVAVMKEQTKATQEQTKVQREQNCIMRFDQKDRMEKAEFCREVTR